MGKGCSRRGQGLLKTWTGAAEDVGRAANDLRQGLLDTWNKGCRRSRAWAVGDVVHGLLDIVQGWIYAGQRLLDVRGV